MSSFGSQARLAELTAAAAARQRQAKRELEEQHRAPKSAPVSLSAFTRTGIASRNKGNKPYKPLTLDDIGEDDRYDPITGDGASSESDGETNSATIVSRSSSADTRRALLVSMAGRTPARMTSYISELSPIRVEFQPHPFHVQHGFPISYEHAASHSAPPDAQQHRFASIMVPQDISPTKQEEKFIELQNANVPMAAESYPTMTDTGPDGAEMYNHAYMQANDPVTNDMRNESCTESGVRTSQYMNTVDADRGSHHPGLQSNSSMFGPGNMSNTSNAPSQYVLTTAPIATSGAVPSDHTSHEDHEETYDASKVMQKFIDETKSRKGKTVIYNPDLHKDGGYLDKEGKDYENSSDQGSHVVTRNPRLRSSTLETALHNPAPGLPFPRDIGPPSLADHAMFETDEDGEWRERMEVLRCDLSFMTLNAGSRRERQRTCKAMAKAAKSLTIHIPDYRIYSGENENRLGEATQWFRFDNRGNPELRNDLEEHVIQDHALKLREAASMENKGMAPSGFKSGVDDGIAINIALTDVYANLSTYPLAGDDKSMEQRRNFHKVKAVPDWATARNTEEKGSYFGGTPDVTTRVRGGFVQPPQRVARDPRFRPTHATATTVRPMATPVTPTRPIGGSSGAGIFAAVAAAGRAKNNRPIDGADMWQARVDSLVGARRG